MGGENVKNTMFERALRIVAPHYCCGCGKVGTLLCDYCKYNIVWEPFGGCIICGKPQSSGICMHHTSPITHAFTVSARTDAVEVLINKLKFERAKAAARVLAELLDERLPLLPENTLLVPVPTVRSHIRQRGYDQVELITRHLARIREMPIVRALERTGHDTFHKLDRAGRQRVSKQAFRLSSSYGVPPDATLLLIDDIITTSTTMNAAAQALSPLGVPVWAAAVAYQPLSGSPLSTR